MACTPSYAQEGEERWRLFEQASGGTVMLAIATTDEGTDALGSPLFRCKRASGVIEVEGVMSADLRAAMAAMIKSDLYPLIQLFPAAEQNTSLIGLFYSEKDEGWQFQFLVNAVGPTFDEFKRTGKLAFKVGTKVIRREFKPGIEKAARFQEICKEPPKPSIGPSPKPSVVWPPPPGSKS
jgi:hypothetical protein